MRTDSPSTILGCDVVLFCCFLLIIIIFFRRAREILGCDKNPEKGTLEESWIRVLTARVAPISAPGLGSALSEKIMGSCWFYPPGQAQIRNPWPISLNK